MSASTQSLPSARTRAIRARKNRNSRILIAVEIIAPLALIAGLMVWTAGAELFYFPPLFDVLTDFPKLWFVDRLTSDVLPSLSRFAQGFVIATLLGIPLGLTLGRFERPKALLAPLLEFFRAIPPVALIPLVILIVGIGDEGKIALIVVVCIWPILLNAMDGASGIEPAYTETATVYRIGPFRRFFQVVLPAALPQIFSGMRVAIALGLILIVTSEMAASTNGIGFVILLAQRSFNLAEMWSGIILLGVLGYLLNLLFEMLERRVIAWHFGSRSQPE